jgi:hypothetical protein
MKRLPKISRRLQMSTVFPPSKLKYSQSSSGSRVLCRPEIRYLTDRVLFVRWPANASITDHDALAAISRIEKLASGERSPMLVDMRGMCAASSGALSKFAKHLSVTRMALVGTTPVEQTIVQFFRVVHQPAYPVSYFSQESEALAWLARTQCRPRRVASTPLLKRQKSAAWNTVSELPMFTGRLRLNKALSGSLTSSIEPRSTPRASPVRQAAAEEQELQPPIHVSPETLGVVTRAFRGKTRPKAFPMALAITETLDPAGVTAFVDLIGGCAAAERGLIVSHLHRHYRRSPVKLALWITTAQDTYFHARARVVNSGIRRARVNPGKIMLARLTDRDSAGHNVRQEIRDAISLVNGLVHSPWPGQIGIGSQRNIISVGATLARVLVTEGDQHGLAGCYREYTDVYDARYSIVEEGTGIIDFILKHPEATDLLCEYIRDGKSETPEALLSAVTSTSQFLRHLQPVGAGG